MTKNEIEELEIEVATLIAEQTEIDNAGDGESVLFQEETPTLNITKLVERLAAKYEITRRS